MPEFASQAYWETRFTNNGAPFDWLIPAQALRDVAAEWTDREVLQNAEVLHIGSGTSESSFLRELVDSPRQIHNVDYSAAAVDAAAARELEIIARDEQDLIDTTDKAGQDSERPSAIPSRMRWSCLDLLSLDSTFSLLDQQATTGRLFDVVLDKSTSDSIACGTHVSLQLPYPLSVNGWSRGIHQSAVVQSAEIHPLHVLAVHLAALTAPTTGKWIAISYSEDRFPFLPPFPRSALHGLLDDAYIKAGFPHPSELWRLEAKEQIDLNAGREETLAERKKRLASGLVHRPQVPHWLYVLVRTDVVVTD